MTAAGSPAGVRGAPDAHEPLPAAPLAGLGRRLAAALYELLLLTALLFVVGFALLPLATPGHAGAVDRLVVPPLATQVMLFCLQFAIAAAYFTWCWTGGRRTLPQKTWRLRLVTTAGEPPDRKAALLRYAAGWIGPLAAVLLYPWLAARDVGMLVLVPLFANYLWALADRERQFLHDRIAHTRVIRAQA
ncbi:MAG: RDD family protein [Proteobacteria bacterium]|nr:RDD family protein [Pseudomonadota bacterium]